jgi:hypothetical protein
MINIMMNSRSRLALDHPQLIAALDELVRMMPTEDPPWPPRLELHDWIGRARALIGAWDSSQDTQFAAWGDSLFERGIQAHSARLQALNARAKMMNLVQLARNELRLITGGRVSMAFDAGQQFDFYDELRKVIETAQQDVFFVDRYMGASFITQYLPHTRPNVGVRLLTRDMLAPLLASANAYASQHGTKIEVRTSNGFHGRFMCIDRSRCFLVDASFKDAAHKAPAALIELSDTASVSMDQYEGLWQGGNVER